MKDLNLKGSPMIFKFKAKLNRLKTISHLILFTFIILICSCKESSPYPEFELKLREGICECATLTGLNEVQFLEEYGKCSEKISDILKNGLDDYPENPDMSKEEYLISISELIPKWALNCSEYE